MKILWKSCKILASLITHVLQKALTLLARVHLLTNNWGAATDAADMVLGVDKKCTKAIQVKAEALFNVCQFEHALVHFYRGMVSMNNKLMMMLRYSAFY